MEEENLSPGTTSSVLVNIAQKAVGFIFCQDTFWLAHFQPAI